MQPKSPLPHPLEKAVWGRAGNKESACLSASGVCFYSIQKGTLSRVPVFLFRHMPGHFFIFRRIRCSWKKGGKAAAGQAAASAAHMEGGTLPMRAAPYRAKNGKAEGFPRNMPASRIFCENHIFSSCFFSSVRQRLQISLSL